MEVLDFGTLMFPGDKNALTILNNGNVGIGTASPTDKLQVNNGNILVQSEIFF